MVARTSRDSLAGEQAMITCGIGCRRGTRAEDIEAVIRTARDTLGCADGIAIIATETSKANEPGLRQAADRLGAKLVSFTTDELESVADALLTVSPAALRHKNVPSVAEAAALLAAGTNARLLAPRIANATATCAFAIGVGSRP